MKKGRLKNLAAGDDHAALLTLFHLRSCRRSMYQQMKST